MNNNYIFLIGCYLIGSIPFSFLYGKIFHNIDITKKGSGNAGATNSLRVLGPKAGAIVMILDTLKGYLPVLYAQHYINSELSYWAAIACILGHIFSIYLGFKGGKGVATSFGVLIALSVSGALIALFSFITIIYATRMVSLGSLVGSFSFFVFSGFAFGLVSPAFLLSAFILFLLLYTHRDNIKAIINGSERKI